MARVAPWFIGANPTSPLERTDRLVVAVRDLAAARRVEDIGVVVRTAARELVRADGAAFVLRDGDYCHYLDEDAVAPLFKGRRVPLKSCIGGWAMTHRQQVAITDIYADDRVPHDAYRPTFVRSLVMTPVRDAEPVAAIGVYWEHHHVARPEELELLQALADSTAVAFESVRVLGELERRVEERTEELAAANRDLRAFAHLAAHDLRTPLLTNAAYIDKAARIDRDRLSVEGRAALEGAQIANEHLSRLIDAILEYSTVAHGDITRASVDLNRVVEDVLHGLDALIAIRGAEVVVERLPPVIGSAALLGRVMQNLIANAIQYGDRDKPVVSLSGGLGEDGSAWVCVHDNGTGVPASEQAEIFEIFTRGSAGRGRSGFGIGLAFAARVMEKHGGCIAVGDSPTGGAEFRITFPA